MKSLLSFLLVLMAFTAQAQEVKESDAYKQAKMRYVMGIQYSDLAESKGALYEMIAMDPQDYSLLDSLGQMYYQFGQYASSAMVFKDVLQLTPGNLLAVELYASALENIGAYDKAVESYENLYLRQNNVLTLYKIAFLQYRLQRFEECKNTSKIVLEDPKSVETNLVFAKQDQTEQEVSMAAAIHNLKGLVAIAEEDKAAAKVSFEKALEISPEFELAMLNKDTLAKE